VGPNGTTQHSANLSGGAASTSFGSLPAGNYTITADPQLATGYVAASKQQSFTVSVPAVAVSQSSIGEYAAASGTTVTLYDGSGNVIGTLAPFSAAEAPTGVRVAVADVNGDTFPDLIVVTGPGAPAQLKVIDLHNNTTLYSMPIFEGFTGGAFVAAADINGDGKADIVVTPDEGGGPRVEVLNGPDGTLLANFFGIEDPNFRGGARASLGDVNGDGIPDLVVSAGFGGGPRIAGFDGKTLKLGAQPTHLFHDFFMFEDALRNGAYVSVGDLNGDGFADIIGGGGPGGAPRVLVFSSKDLIGGNSFVPLANFFAGSLDLRGGVRVTAKDEDGDGREDLVTGSGDTHDLLVFLGSDLETGNTTPKRSVVLPGNLAGVYVG
jgi:hypothetical protein